MKVFPAIAGALLGLLFVASGLIVLLGLAPSPEIPEGTPIAHFLAAFGPTGYFTFIKVLEVSGGILVAIPLTRNLGLLVLGPIIVNILAFHILITGGEGLLSPMIVGICLLAAFLLWSERRVWTALVTRTTPSPQQP